MRDKLRFLFAATILMIPALHWAESQQGVIEGIGITSRGTPAIRVALPEFRPNTTDAKAAQLTKMFNDVLWSDLEFSGNIELASRSFYPIGNFATQSDIRVEEWTKPGIEAAYIAFGITALDGGNFRAEARLEDLKSQQQIFGNRYPGTATEESARLMAHMFADDILKELGFGKGITRTQIAFVCKRGGNKEICLMDYDGSNVRPLTAIRDISIIPAFSPDGQKVAYTTYRNGTPAIEIMLTTGQRAAFEQPRGVSNITAAWSPDNGYLAYSSAGDIYVAAWNGKEARKITQTPNSSESSPSWNPKTGRQIVFVSNRSGTPQLYMADSDGTNVVQLIDEGGDAENPSWSPDGRFIAFAWAKARGNFDIHIHDISTGKNIQLTQNAGNNERPTWAPDGKHLAFQSNRTGTTQIYSMLANGGKVRQLTNTGELNEGPSWSGYMQ